MNSRNFNIGAAAFVGLALFKRCTYNSGRSNNRSSGDGIVVFWELVVLTLALLLRVLVWIASRHGWDKPTQQSEVVPHNVWVLSWSAIFLAGFGRSPTTVSCYGRSGSS